MSPESLVLFFIVAIFLVSVGIIMSRLLAPRSMNPQKQETYECGIPAFGGSWLQFHVGYYLFAILFLIFDVETVFLFPWSVVMQQGGIKAFVEVIIFVFVLALGLLYAWKKGALKWE